jgi:hypothetical protein
MAQSLQTGHTFTNTELVTGDLMNQMVNNAVVLPAIIDGQDAIGSVALTDTLLVTSSGVLKKATVSQVSAGLQLNQFLKTNGSVVMDADAQLQLGSSEPTIALHAVSLGKMTSTLGGYLVNSVPSGYYAPFNGILGVSGGGILLASGNALVLGKDPTNALEAATKQYVDATNTIKAKCNFSGNPATTGGGTTVGCTYTRANGQQYAVINSSPTAHGFKQGHKLYLNSLSGTPSQIPDNYYAVSEVIDQYQFKVNTTASTVINTGTCQFTKLEVRNSNGIDSVIWGTYTGNTGYYFVNFTNNFSSLDYSPVFSLTFSGNSGDSASASGVYAVCDKWNGTVIPRSLNSMAFTVEGGQAGYRCGMIVF